MLLKGKKKLFSIQEGSSGQKQKQVEFVEMLKSFYQKRFQEIKPCNIGYTGSISAGLDLSHIGNSEALHEINLLDATRDVSLNYSPSHVDSLAAATLVVDNIGQTDSDTPEESNMDDETCHIAICNSHQTHQSNNDTDHIDEEEISYAEKCSTGHIEEAGDRTIENIITTNRTCNVASGTWYPLDADTDVSMKEVSCPANSPSLHVFHPPLESFDTEM